MRRLAEEGRVHVTAAGEQEAVERAGELLERRGRELRRQRHRNAAGLLDRVQVAGIHVGPLGICAHRDGGADADEGQAVSHGGMLAYAP
jgi:hypothetical protein